MLYGINQKSEGLLREIRSDGCLFLCFAESSPVIFTGRNGIEALNFLWEKAKTNKIIDDTDTILDHDKLAELFMLKVKYDGQHHSPEDKIEDKVKIVFGQYFWKYGHFVVLNKSKEVIFDPLVISNSVKNGTLKSMRWYYAD